MVYVSARALEEELRHLEEELAAARNLEHSTTERHAEEGSQETEAVFEVREHDDDIDEIGAGDQGMMFGYACDETVELMPLPITLAHVLTRRLSEARKTGVLPYLRPDGKSQVTVRYEGDRPVGVEKILVFAQHRDGMEHRIRDDIIAAVIRPVMPERFFDKGAAELLVNPTGRFVTGGPRATPGLPGARS